MRRRYGASFLPGTCDTPDEWHQQLGEPTPAITLAYTVTLEETAPLGGGLGAYRRMAFVNSVASSLSPHAVRSSARDRAGEAVSGHS